MLSFRSASDADIPRLISIWERSFGDSAELATDFLRRFGIETCVAGELDGEIICAAYVLPTGGLYTNRGVLSCSYIYALAVLPEHRGHGCGRKLTQAAVHASSARGFALASLKPTDAGLYGFYRRLGFSDFFTAETPSFKRERLAALQTCGEISAVTPEEYLRLRESALENVPHIVPSHDSVAFQASLGTLYAFSSAECSGCAAVETDGVRADIKELILSHGKADSAVSLIAEVSGAAEYRVRLPSRNGKPDGMLYSPPDEVFSGSFLGLAFD